MCRDLTVEEENEFENVLVQISREVVAQSGGQKLKGFQVLRVHPVLPLGIIKPKDKKSSQYEEKIARFMAA